MAVRGAFKIGKIELKNTIIILALCLLASCSQVKKTEKVNNNNNQKNELSQIFETDSDKTWLLNAIKKANCVSTFPIFLGEIEEIKSFNFTEDSGKEVAKNLKLGKVLKVKTYKTWNPWSKVNAYFSNDTIYLNLWNNPRSLNEMVNTLIHEYSHLYYSHNGNYKTKENLESVPYKIGDISEKYVSVCND